MLAVDIVHTGCEHLDTRDLLDDSPPGQRSLSGDSVACLAVANLLLEVLVLLQELVDSGRGLLRLGLEYIGKLIERLRWLESIQSIAPLPVTASMRRTPEAMPVFVRDLEDADVPCSIYVRATA